MPHVTLRLSCPFTAVASKLVHIVETVEVTTTTSGEGEEESKTSSPDDDVEMS